MPDRSLWFVPKWNAQARGDWQAHRDDWGDLAPDLSLEDIVVGLLQPHAPADLRALKLVVRILQSGRVSLDGLVFLARRERALSVLAWLVDLIPEAECTELIIEEVPGDFADVFQENRRWVLALFNP